MKYVALLLGVNVGRRVVKMARLKEAMEALGYTDVQTLLASGNVCFAATTKSAAALVKQIEPALTKEFGFEIQVIVRTAEEIIAIIELNPFKAIKKTPSMHFYVTFLSERPPATARPRTSAGYKLFKVTDTEAYSMLDMSKFEKAPELMKEAGQKFGKKITTRNWNTVQKIHTTLSA
jgi:uncharacterized protein (DUF1697 family)